MVFEGSQFVFQPPPPIKWARRVLIKPCASYPLPHPITTSRETLEVVISGIRQVSDADIIFLEGNPQGKAMRPIYQSLSYDFPRVLSLDVKDCVLVEIENPLIHPFALPTFWLPNIVLYCDYLISIAPLKIFKDQGIFTIGNLISLLPLSKYQEEIEHSWGSLYSPEIHRVIADLYFALPFDLGIIDARKKFIGSNDPTRGEVEDFNKIFIGEPYEVDWEASEALGLATEYVRLIGMAKGQLEKKNAEQ